MKHICEAFLCDKPAHRYVGGRYVCDECYLTPDHIYFKHRATFFERHPRIAVALYILLFAYIIGGAVAFAVAMLQVKL